ncbi:MAG TPA: flagellar motor switch protein FliM, partial [bacterium]|nr:flagellar motor switch protein FliM [bacterium]
MAEQLSQADIDALLNTFSSESESSGSAPAAAAPGRASRPQPEVKADEYDFSHPDLLSRDQVRSLRTLHEGYAQALAKRLSTEFLTNVSASVVSIDHLTYTEFLMLLPTPTVLSVIDVPDLEGNIAIELNPNVAFAFIDRLLGGEGMPVGKLRPLTAIEQGLMERVLQKCCHEMAGVWAPIRKLDFLLQAIEANPELARVVGPHEMIVLVSMELRINDVSGMMNLCLPH